MILDEIIKNTKRQLPENNLFSELFTSDDLKFICELKMKSPTNPEGFSVNPAEVFDDYAQVADAISVVTDHDYFGGSLQLVSQARQTGKPILRKDFIIDPQQIKQVDTDALLLIARIVDAHTLIKLVNICLTLNIEPVVEVFDDDDLQKALSTSADIIAVNSRNLQAQTIDLNGAFSMLNKIPNDKTKLLFSGIKSVEDVAKAKKAGVQGVLVGTSILESDNRTGFINTLREQNE